MKWLSGGFSVGLVLFGLAQAQVIEFESNGLKYQTLTRSGVTIMWAPMQNHLHTFAIIQAAISNGSAGPYVIRPEDFAWVRPDGSELRASPAVAVVNVLLQKGSGGDVIKLVTTYEAALYGNPHFKSTNGYEMRRQGALAMTATRAKAAATASAIALVQTKMARGESTDGAVFFATDGKPLGQGRLVIRTNTDTFDFTTTE
jgi:hypothetical protein